MLFAKRIYFNNVSTGGLKTEMLFWRKLSTFRKLASLKRDKTTLTESLKLITPL